MNDYPDCFLIIVFCKQIVKQLWQYIRKNNLQDPSNKRKIICDDALRVVFETDCTDMFKMNKLLAKHIIPLESSSMYCEILEANCFSALAWALEKANVSFVVNVHRGNCSS